MHRWSSFATLAAPACAAPVQPARYSFDAERTQRVMCCEDEPPLAGAEALVLLAPGVHLCIGRVRVGSALDPPACRSVRGPAQVVLPRGERDLVLWSTDGDAALESEYSFRHDFEPGRIYEVFTVDRGDTVEWQLYSVSPERYERLHARAPVELRTAPRPPDPPTPLAVAPGAQQDGSMLWPGDDVLPPLQTALLWPCPGREADPEEALDYPALRSLCRLGFLELDDDPVASNAGTQARALEACLAERFESPSEWRLATLPEGDPCHRALGKGWYVPSHDELERLAVESRRHWGSNQRVTALPANLRYVVARDERSQLVQSARLSDFTLSPGPDASLLCVHTVVAVPLSAQRPSACPVVGADPQEALATDTAARVHQAVETRYGWAADRLMRQLPHLTRQSVLAEPRVIEDLTALPERLEQMTQRYAKTLPPISLRRPGGSPAILRLRDSLREVAALLEPGPDQFRACMERGGDKRACSTEVGDTKKASELRHALRRLGFED